jgi:hypothetical protein
MLVKEDSQILTVDGFDTEARGTALSPGVHFLTVQYSVTRTSQSMVADPQGRLRTQTTTYESKSEPIHLSFTFEEGKYYYLDYEIARGATIFDNRTIQFSITEITDPAVREEAQKGLAGYKTNYKIALENYQNSLEKLNEFLVFSENNPHHLEGTWNGTFAPMKPVQLTFTGDRITLYRNYTLGTDLLMEGRFYFNDEIIIAFFEKRPLVEKPKQIWYYELNGNTLNIIDAPISGLDTIKGKYQKSN